METKNARKKETLYTRTLVKYVGESHFLMTSALRRSQGLHVLPPIDEGLRYDKLSLRVLGSRHDLRCWDKLLSYLHNPRLEVLLPGRLGAVLCGAGGGSAGA